MDRLTQALTEIDAANSADPNCVLVDGREVAAELAYGRRMSGMLARVYPDASELVRIAARAQHIRRWEVPRASYPMDRPGYLRWRRDLGLKHGQWTAEILTRAGYGEPEIARAASLVRKENFRRDAEAQAIEDVAALVFLAHYAEDFAAKHAPEKVVGILVKTLSKMSDHAKSAAAGLELSSTVKAALEAAVAQAGTA
jgi:hypothetical protein